MGKPKAKLWFKVSQRNSELVEFVVCSSSGDKIAKSLGRSAKHYNIEVLTWMEIAELTGCVIPVAMNKGGVAAGDLVMQYNNNLFIMKFV